MRLRELDSDSMTDAQKRIVDAALAGRLKRVHPPLRAWLHSAEMADRAQHLGEYLRWETSLGRALSEIAILVTARFWTSHYEWFAHKREALKAGIDPAIIDAIAARQTPDFADPKARTVYEFALTLHRDHAVPDALYASAKESLGEQGVLELVGLLGYYTLVSMILNAFEIGLPSGETSDLPA